MSKSFFFLSITPLKLKARSVNLKEPEFERLLLYPPNNRRSGWNMDFPRTNIQLGANSLQRGDEDYAAVTLMSNGHMDLVVNIENAFFWPQSEIEITNNPRFNPYAVCEFPATFLRLYKLIIGKANLNGPFVINLGMHGVKNVTLWPGDPKSMAYGVFLDTVQTCKTDDLNLDPVIVDDLSNPDEVAFDLVAEIYREFGHSAESVPFFYNSEFAF